MEPNRRTSRFQIDDGVAKLKKGDVYALYSLWARFLEINSEPEPEGEDRYWHAYALYHFGIALERYKHHAHAFDVLSTCVTKFEHDSDEDIAYLVNQALFHAGLIAKRGDRFEEAIKYLDQAIDRLQSASSMEDRRVLAGAVVDRAGSLLKSGALQEAVEAFTGAYARFKEDNDPEVCRQIAWALQERALVLGETAPEEDRSAAAYGEFFFECEDSKDPDIKGRVFPMRVKMPKGLRPRVSSPREPKADASRHGRYLVEEVMNPAESGGTDERVAKFDEALLLFGDNPEGEDQVWAARAMFHRAGALQSARRNQEAVAAYAAVIERFEGSSNDEIRMLVTVARGEAGVASGAMGDFDTAVSCLNASIEDLKNASQRDDRRRLARAMFNLATMFREAGRTEEAVQAFDATYERFVKDDDPNVCQFVGLAVFNKANGLRQAGKRDRAMPALRFAFDHCAESHDPLVRERAVRALFSLAGEYAALGQMEEWAATLHELAVRCGSAGEPAIQKIIDDALEVCPALLTSLPAASHSLRSEYNRQQFITILSEVGDRSDLLDKAWQDHIEYLERTDKEARDSHAEAVKVLTAYWMEKKPFAIMLRNFASEAFEHSMPVEGADFPIRALFIPKSNSVEERIQAAVGPGIPLISISNPTPHLWGPGKIPKLEMRNEIWETAIKIVIDIAGLILVKLDKVTEGVLKELQAIVNEGRQFSTVVIVGYAARDNELVGLLKAAQLAGGEPPDDPSIPRFAWVIEEFKLPAAGGEPLVEFHNLMQKLGRFR